VEQAMYVIKLPNGNLLVPESATATVQRDGEAGGGSYISDVYVEIGPDDADYERLVGQAMTQEEFDERRRRWQDGDEPLRRQFLDFLARGGNPGQAHDPRGGQDGA
jgi:hypothetical protein